MTDRNDASRVEPALAVDPSRSSPNAVDTNTLATPAPSPVSGEPDYSLAIAKLKSAAGDVAHEIARWHEWKAAPRGHPDADRLIAECEQMAVQFRAAANALSTLPSLLSDRERLQAELKRAQDFANRWITAALNISPPAGAALAFDPMNPEAFARSRAAACLVLVEDRLLAHAEVERMTRELEAARYEGYRDGYYEGLMQPSSTVESDTALAAKVAKEYVEARRASLPSDPDHER